MIHSGVKFVLKAVVTGFSLSLGAALFKKIQGRLGLAEEDKKESAADSVTTRDGAIDPELQRQ